MDNIYLEKGVKTPKILFDFNKGVFLLEGVSVPENTVDFYNPMVYSLREYVENPRPHTTLDVKMEYFNTSTSVILLNIFRTLAKLPKKQLTINWYFEEDDIEMEEAGQDYANMIEAQFNIIPIESFK